MKKTLLLLLLLPFLSIGQVSNGTETEFEALKTTNSQTITTPIYMATMGTDQTIGKIPSAYIEKTANKQNSMLLDGTGDNYPTSDALNKIITETAKVWSNTGLYNPYDETFYLQQLSTTTFRIHPVKRGFFADILYTLPPNISGSIVENTPIKDVNVNTLGIPNVIGRYYRFIGYDKNLNVISSLSNFNSDMSTIGLGFVIVDADGLGNFVLSFPPTSLPTIAGNSQLERDLSNVLTNVNVSANNNNTFNSSAGNLTGSGIGWVSGVTSQGSPNKKVIALQAVTQFILQNPLTSSGLPPSFTTAVSGLNYWNGSAMVATGNNNYVVKRLLLSATGNYILQESEVRYTTGTKIENFNAAKTNATSQSFTNTGSIVPDTYAIVGYWVLDNAATPNLSDVTTYAFIKAGVNSGGGASVSVADATETIKGIVELATAAETTTGTDNTRAVHPQGLKVELDKKENLVNKATNFTTVNNTLYPTVQAVSRQIAYVTPEQYGAVGDGITNDAVAIQNAINSSISVHFGDKTYLTNSTITIATAQNIIGNGNLSIIKTNSNLPVFDIQSGGVKISNFTILGSGRASATDYVTTFPLQNGIKISGFYFDIKIDNMFFDNLGNAGIYGLDNTITSSVAIKSGVSVNNCDFRNNLIGIFWDTEFEFNLVNNCNFRDNEWGIRNNAGNNAYLGGQNMRNRKGYSLESGLNNAHSVVNGVHFNQNLEWGIYANGVTNGHVFSNCVVFFNKIEVINSTGITFDGGEYGVSSGGLNVSGSINTTFQNINFLTTPPITESGNTNLKFFNNTFVGTRPTNMTESIDNIRILNTNTNIPALTMNTGLTGLNSGITAMPYGSINFGNAQSSTASPLMAGKSNDNSGLFLIGLAADGVNQGDMRFDARKSDNTEFSTLTNIAFKFSRFSATTLMDIYRNGDVNILGVTTVKSLIAEGLKFPSTQVPSANVNTLDDYEEGTFSPLIEGTATAGAATYTTQDGFYTKIGNLVTVNIKMVWTAHTGTGSLIIRGLPFTVRKTDAQGSIYGDAIVLTANNYIAAIASKDTTTILIRQTPTGTIASNVVAMDTAATMTVNVTYMTD
jgi:hypothetical protein